MMNQNDKENIKPRRNINFILKNNNQQLQGAARSKENSVTIVQGKNSNVQSLKIKKKQLFGPSALIINRAVPGLGPMRETNSLRITRKQPTNQPVFMPQIQNIHNANAVKDSVRDKNQKQYRKNRSTDDDWDCFIKDEFKLEKIRV